MDWLKKWRETLAPFPVGAHFFVIPDSSKLISAPVNRLPIYLEPGMAFGTGSHETTQLCLESLETELLPGSLCFDVGTGSGILAIAAAKLGARKIVACDPDPIAIQIAKVNSSRNRCASRIKWVLGEAKDIGKSKCDILVANLTFEIIEQELFDFESKLKKGATLILSGLLKSQADTINQLIKSTRLVSKARIDRGEWSCLIYEEKHATASRH
jgi:ribosomal protein L11 methyltransferase